ncbi:MAG TPA: winged helix DNA-binding domain-containing protein [Blastocatellia bacterium]|nr:winged helix DNA-binding domain-containing protein [Blastocatellia bacterium]
MTNIDITRQRLYNQRLRHTTFTQPGEVVQWLGAMQAQDYAGAKWAIAQRALGLTDAALDQALADGTILRTHILRPTWHFVTPADIRWMLQLTAPRVNALNAYHYRKQELDDAVFKQSNAVLTKSLRGGQQLTRAELAAALHRAGIVTDELRSALLLMRAELDGVVCSGARRGKQFTYALLEERVPPVPPRTKDEALAELSTRYLLSRGPATVQDFVWWSGLTTSEAKTGIEMVQSQFHREAINKQTYWFPAHAPTTRTKTPLAHLLATYDEYLIGYKDRSAAVNPALAERIVGGEVFTSTIVLDGQVIGVWKRTLKARSVSIATTFFTTLTKAQSQAVAAAAQQYATFLHLPLAQEN